MIFAAIRQFLSPAVAAADLKSPDWQEWGVKVYVKVNQPKLPSSSWG